MWPGWQVSPISPAASRKNLTAFLDEGSESRAVKNLQPGNVLLNGKFQGEIASPDTLIIGERGVGETRVSGPARSWSTVSSSATSTE